MIEFIFLVSKTGKLILSKRKKSFKNMLIRHDYDMNENQSSLNTNQ